MSRLDKIVSVFQNPNIQKKIYWTLGLLVLYKLLVYVPVPFVNIGNFLAKSGIESSGLGYFAMLLGGSLDNFSIIAVGLTPYINASIIMQLAGSIFPHIEELQEQGEAGQKKIQQYTRWLALPLAFLQSIGMVYLINQYLGGGIIYIQEFYPTVFMSAVVLTMGSMLLMRIGELITEKGIANGTSLIIFASIVTGLTSSISSGISAASNLFLVGTAAFLLFTLLVVLAVFIIRTVKEIPVIYARQGKIQQTSTLPFPLNPVGMVPIIFAIAFVSFPYLITQLLTKIGSTPTSVQEIAKWIEINFNFYAGNNQSIWLIVTYFVLIVVFTFFYAKIQFNPERIADNIQSKGGYIPSIRPGKDTTRYINNILMHLCLRGGIGLGVLGVYSFILEYIPALRGVMQQLGSIPAAVTGSGIVIIVGVVQDLINKIDSELLMSKYDE